MRHRKVPCKLIIIIVVVIMKIVVISRARYLIDKDEHTVLYKIRQTYKYTFKPLKKKNVYIYIHIIFPTPQTHTHTHVHTHKQICGSAERELQWGGGG